MLARSRMQRFETVAVSQNRIRKSAASRNRYSTSWRRLARPHPSKPVKRKGEKTRASGRFRRPGSAALRRLSDTSCGTNVSSSARVHFVRKKCQKRRFLDLLEPALATRAIATAHVLRDAGVARRGTPASQPLFAPRLSAPHRPLRLSRQGRDPHPASQGPPPTASIERRMPANLTPRP
jgi:hypothetical protein